MSPQNRIQSAICCAFTVTLLTGWLAASSPERASPARVVEAYGQLPLSFEANQGQTDPRVRFLSRGRSYTVFLTTTEAVLVLHPHARKSPGRRARSGRAHPSSRAVLRVQALGARPSPRVEGIGPLPGTSNYFIGKDPRRWRAGIPNYARVHYHDLYPGIDLVYYGNRRELEYDFLLAPGADPARIELAFDGAQDLRVDARGDLLLQTSAGEVRQRKPRVFQVEENERREVAGRYVIRGHRRIGFELSRYDRTKPIVVDPVLVYSTYLGGSGFDGASGIAVDAQGNAYVTGVTEDSPDFPTVNSLQAPHPGSGDAYVAKLNRAGTALLFSTYLGGSDEDEGFAIAVEPSGEAYVTGYTASDDFPTTPGAFQTDFVGDDAFVTKLNRTGSALVYSSYLGGSGLEIGRGIAVEASGEASVTGVTSSDDFPVTSGALQPRYGGGDSDAFVAKVNRRGSALLYATYLGGSGEDEGAGIALEQGAAVPSPRPGPTPSSAAAYVTGFTSSTDFPTTIGAFQTAFGGGSSDAFVAKVNSSGSRLAYSTYLGGGDSDEGAGIDVDPSGDAYVTGSTSSANFPTTANVFQPAYGGGGDAFVARLHRSGSSLVFSTYFGGSGGEVGHGIAVDSSGHAHVAGFTSSLNLPIANAFQPSSAGSGDAFVMKISRGGTLLLYSSYLGGSGNDEAFGVALSPGGDTYVTGVTESPNFPTTPGALRPAAPGGVDGFVTRVSS